MTVEITTSTGEEILQSVTPIYNKDDLALAIFEANGTVMHDIGKTVEGLKFEMYPQNATWTIGYWEQMLGIKTHKTLPNAERVQRVLLELNKYFTITKVRLETIVNSFIVNKKAYIEDVDGEYAFVINVPPESKFTKELFDVVEEVKPAHLAASFATKRDFDLGIHIGGAVSEYQITNILTPKFEMQDLHSTISYGALVAKYETTQIETLLFTMPDLQISNSYGGAFSCWRKTTILSKEVV